MTISSETTRILYAGNDSTTVFAYPFKIYAAADLIVIVRDADGIETVQTLTTHYSVSGAGVATGGNVTMVTAPAATEYLLIMRDAALTQASDYIAGGKFPAETHEDTVDKLTLLMQQLEERLDRSAHIKRTSSLTDIEISDVTAGEYLRWNLAGDGIDSIAQVDDLGTFLQSGTGAVSRTAASKMGERVTVADFGALATSIQSALDSGAKEVFAEPGTYNYSTGLIVPAGVSLICEGYGEVILNYQGTGWAITCTDLSGKTLSGFKLVSGGANQSGLWVKKGTLAKVEGVFLDEFETLGLRIGYAGVSGVYYSAFNNVYVDNGTDSGTLGMLIDGQAAINSNANTLRDCVIQGDIATMLHIKGNNNNWRGGDISWGANTPTDVIKIEGIGNVIDNAYMEATGLPTRIFNATATAFRNKVKVHGSLGTAILNIDGLSTDLGVGNEMGIDASIGYNYPFSVEDLSGENLVANSQFWHWTSGVPTGWSKDDDTIADETSTVKGSTHSAKLTGAANNPGITCVISGSGAITGIPIARLQGRTLIAGVWAKTSVASMGNIKVWSDGTGGAGRGLDVHTGGNTWEFLTAMGYVPTDATLVKLLLRGAESGTPTGDVYFSEPILVIGSHLPRPSPHPLNDTCSVMHGVLIHNRPIAFADDATPSVALGNTFLTGGTTTITDFDDGTEGQIITVIAEHSLDITDGTNIFLSGSANWSMTATDTLTLVCKADNKWYEMARGDNGA